MHEDKFQGRGFNLIQLERSCNLKRMIFSLIGLIFMIRSCYCQNQPYITRQHPSDLFHIRGSCREDACIGESSGTAELAESCTCRCLSHLPVFREDLHICVDDIHECSVAPFVTGATYQKVPYVFLPLKGQIVHPSSDIRFTDVKSPICVVSSAKYLTRGGWVELRNKSEAEPPFRLFKDEGKTYLQWLGESDMRLYMEGRLILIHLLCKDVNDVERKENRIFTPCVSFRVAGTPSGTNPWTGVREVSFSVDSQTSNNGNGSGYISVALCSVVIGLVYVTSVVLYIQLRKKNTHKKKSPASHIGVAEEGVVKNNPLLRHCHENVLYLPESAPSCTDSDGSSDRIHLSDDNSCDPATNVQITSAVIHPCSLVREKEKNVFINLQSQDPVIEKHPEENVSIVETLESRDDKSDKICAIACSNVRRKLYFNPAFFQHELLLAPPPAAIEFLTKIREVISIAKAKMQAKRFSPTLLRIPEENENRSSDGETCNSRMNQYTASMNSNRLFSSDGSNGCRNCCKTPENKQRSVEKWLANVPIVNNEFSSADGEDKTSVCSEWTADNSSFKLTKLRKGFFPPDNNEESTSESKLNYCNRNMLLFDNPPKKKIGETLLKGDKTPDILYSIPLISTTLDTTTIKENVRNSTSSFKGFNPTKNMTKEDSGKAKSLDQASVKSDFATDEQTSQYEFIGSQNYEDSKEESELETVEFKGGYAVSCDYVDIHNSDIGIQQNNYDFQYCPSENPYSRNTLAMSDLQLNERKEDHDYEMIMMNNIEETKSLPDFSSRTDGYSLISEVYVNSGYGYSSSQSSVNSHGDSVYSAVSEKQIKVIKDGLEHLTINIKEVRTNHHDGDSDNFEPDTLDRKPNNLIIPGDTTSKLQITNDFFTDSLERQAQISLKTSGSFKEDFGCVHSTGMPNRNRGVVLNRAFGSLREIFMAKNKYNQCTHRGSKPSTFTNVLNSTRSLNQISNLYWSKERYQTLKPESKQAKRQRQPDPLISPPQPPDFMIDLPNDLPTSPVKPFKLNSSMKENRFPNGTGHHDFDKISSISYPVGHMCKNHQQSSINRCDQSPISDHQINPRLNLRNLERFGNRTYRIGNVQSKMLDYEPITSQTHLDLKKIEHNSSRDKLNKLSNHANHLHNRTEDSGYLSTDSNTSDKPLRRDGSLSETDDSFFDGASESGAESIATDSFFFGKISQNSLAKHVETQS